MDDQLHAQAALPLRKKPSARMEYGICWSREPVRI